MSEEVLSSYKGHAATADDAILLIQGCRLGTFPRITRRLDDAERKAFIVAGATFVWEEVESGMQRWTDGRSWSPSRIHGSFLVYTEIPAKRTDNLVKRSISFSDPDAGRRYHLVGYYTREGVQRGDYMLPTGDPQLRFLQPSATALASNVSLSLKSTALKLINEGLRQSRSEEGSSPPPDDWVSRSIRARHDECFPAHSLSHSPSPSLSCEASSSPPQAASPRLPMVSSGLPTGMSTGDAYAFQLPSPRTSPLLDAICRSQEDKRQLDLLHGSKQRQWSGLW